MVGVAVEVGLVVDEQRRDTVVPEGRVHVADRVPLDIGLGDADLQDQVVDVEFHRGAGDEVGDVQRRVVLQVGRDEVFPHEPGHVDAEVPQQADLDHRADLAGCGDGAEVDVLALDHPLVEVDVDAIGTRRYAAALFEILEFDRRVTFIDQETVVELHGLGGGRQRQSQGHQVGWSGISGYLEVELFPENEHEFIPWANFPKLAGKDLSIVMANACAFTRTAQLITQGVFVFIESAIIVDAVELDFHAATRDIGGKFLDIELAAGFWRDHLRRYGIGLVTALQLHLREGHVEGGVVGNFNDCLSALAEQAPLQFLGRVRCRSRKAVRAIEHLDPLAQGDLQGVLRLGLLRDFLDAQAEDRLPVGGQALALEEDAQGLLLVAAQPAERGRDGEGHLLRGAAIVGLHPGLDHDVLCCLVPHQDRRFLAGGLQYHAGTAQGDCRACQAGREQQGADPKSSGKQ
ncbi:hypothetical protein FQZ97_615610 [compost metagenome]